MSEPSERNLAEFEKWIKGRFEFVTQDQYIVAKCVWLACFAEQAEREKAAVAAALEIVAAKLDHVANGYDAGGHSHRAQMLHVLATETRVSITPDQQSALDRHDAERSHEQWLRGYGDGISSLGAVLCGAPLGNLNEMHQEQAKRWIAAHQTKTREKVLGPIRPTVEEMKLAAKVLDSGILDKLISELESTIQESIE